MRYVIIGNSAAGIGAVEGIRSVDRDGQITIISDESYHTYSRPLISYLLQGKTDEERMRYRPDDFYEKNDVTLLLNSKAARVDTAEKKAVLESGQEIPYDKLLIATGSRPFVPPIKGLDTVKNPHTFMKLDDAKALADSLHKDARVLIIGAGLIGLKCAEGIAGRCSSIAVADIAPHVLPSILDDRGAQIVTRVLQEHGLDLYTGCGIEELRENEAVTSDGRVIPFDELVVAVGVRPNTEIYPGEAKRGIVVDENGKTGVADIYAAGDVATSEDITSGTERILALLPNAYMQGHSAGVSMAGGSEPYDHAMPANALGLFGLHMITAGSMDGDATIREKDGTYKKLVVRDGVLVGFITIGDVARSGIYTALIRNRKPLSEIDFDLICEKPQLMAFSRKERAKVLRGRTQ